MRLFVSLAVGLSLAAATPASATKLSGKSFEIDKKTSKQNVNPFPFALDGANFGVSFVEDTDRDDRPDTVSLQLFKAKGKPDGKKIKVAKGKPGAFDSVNTRQAGAVGLSKGKALIGYLDNRTISPTSSGGLFGQIVKKGKTAGDELVIDTETTRSVAFATFSPLSSGALATWSAYDNGAYVTTGRLISSSGKLGDADIMLTRTRSDFTGAVPFGKGFIATWLGQDGDAPVIYARTYDEAGQPVGSEKLISPANKPVAFINSRPVALGDDTILVLNATSGGSGADLIAQLYDADLNPIGEPKTILPSLINSGYAVQPLGGGEFIVGARVKDGASASALAFARFDDKLKQVGGTARAPVNGANVTQMVTLDSGEVVALYSVNAMTLTGQLIKP